MRDGRRRPLSRFDFSFVFPRMTYGDIDLRASEALMDLKVSEMVHGSAIVSVVEDFPDDGRTQIALDFEPFPPHLSAFLLIDEGSPEQPRWTLGLVETLEWFHALGYFD